MTLPIKYLFVSVQVALGRRDTGSLSAFAAAAFQERAEVDRSQPLPAQQKQPQLSHKASQAQPAPMRGACHRHACSRAATEPQMAAERARVSPRALLAAPMHVPAAATVMQPVSGIGLLQKTEDTLTAAPSRDEHKAESTQLLEDACRQAPVHRS